MKLILIFLFVFATSVLAQRRLFTPEASPQEPLTRTTRGRARFSIAETQDVPQDYEKPRTRSVNRNPQSRVRSERRNLVTSTTEADYIQRGYEVKEVIEEAPRNDYQPNKISSNPPEEVQPLNTPLPSEENIEPLQEPSSNQSLLPEESSQNLESSPETPLQTESYSKIKNDVPSESTIPRREEKSQRISERGSSVRGQQTNENSAPTLRRRTRVRGNIDAAPSSTTTRTVTRIIRKNNRRNPDPSTATLTAEQSVTNEVSKRSRTGRKNINPPPAAVETPTRTSGRRAPPPRPDHTTETYRIQSRRRGQEQPPAPQPLPTAATRNLPNRRESHRPQPTEPAPRSAPPTRTSRRESTAEDLKRQPSEAIPRRSRSRSRFSIPASDQQLEVLPLFEREDEASSKNEINRRLDDTTTKSRKTTTSTTPRTRVTHKPYTIRESVVSHVSEVTSKSTITLKPRKRYDSSKNKPREKTTVKVSSSEEEIEESDNYPEPFKALIQAKKQKSSKGTVKSAPAKRPTPTFTTTKKPATTTQHTKKPTKLADIKETTKKAPATTRKFSPHTRTSRITTPRTTRSTVETIILPLPPSSTIPPKESRSQLKTLKKLEVSPTLKPRSYSRKLYSSRKSEDDKRIHTTPLPVVTAKSNRYSSRYRKNTSGRVGNAPVYQPTVPTIRTTTVARSMEDKDLGLEVITFDDPVYTPSSANLVTDNYTKSTQQLVAESQTAEKPKQTLIEQIISSITAISTTQTPETITTITTPMTITTEPTKPSTILKLATKKMQSDNLITTEKPTTVIERILNSLSAIQSQTTSSELSNDSSQVGSNYNTISISTTPMSNVEQSTLAPSTPNVNNLDVLDSISLEEILQKHTLESLLTLLNSLSSTTDIPPTPQQEQTTTLPDITTLYTTTTQATDPTTVLAETTETMAGNIATTTTESTPTTSTTPTVTTSTPIETTTTPTATTTSSTTTISNEIFSTPTIGGFEATTFEPTTETTFYTTISNDIDQQLFQSSPLPPLIRFEVSPGSVSIYSANDLSVTRDESSNSTVTIPSRNTASSTSTTSTTPNPLSLSNIETSNEIEPKSTTDDSPTTTTTPPTTTTNNTTTPKVPFTSPIPTSNTSNQTDSMPNNNNETTTMGSARRTLSERVGHALEPITIAPTPSISMSSTPSTVSPDRDYYIFAVLNNNTILRKRPSAFPNKETPFLIVGVYPNNTIVKKFPNGTIVPMEPAIRVSGFDTRANPPTLPEITNNQVTPDKGSPVDNTNLQMVEQNTKSSLEANALSVNLTDNTSSTENLSATLSNSIDDSESSRTTTTESIKTTTNPPTTVATTMTPATTTTSSTSGLSQLTELLNGNTVKAFNNIINISDLTGRGATTEDSTTTLRPTLSNRILDSGLTTERVTITTDFPTTTPIFSTTNFPSLGIFSTILPRIISAPPRITTIPPTVSWYTTNPPTTLPPTTIPPTTTTTESTTFTTTTTTTTTTQRPTTTPPPTTTTTTVTTTTTAPPTTTTIRTTTRPPTTTTRPPTTTTLPPTTTVVYPSTRYTTVRYTTPFNFFENEISSTFSNTQPSTEKISVSASSPVPFVSSTKKPRQLTKQQLADLQTLAQLEAEQAAILKQLAFLNTLNLRTAETTTPNPSILANRIIQLAVERSKQNKSSSAANTMNDASKIEQLLKDLPTSPPGNSGKSNDAIIAELLKNQGIVPTTPESLDNIYAKTTTKKPRTTTTTPRPRAPVLMQGLRWLLNAFNPPATTTQKPKPKPKSKPKTTPEPEILENQPTHITPVTAASPSKSQNQISQEDVKSLIKKLEAIQKDPSKKRTIDPETKAKLQTLLDARAVDVVTSGSTGVSASPDKSETKAKRGRTVSSTTRRSVVVSNSVYDYDELETTTTSKPRVSLPPVRLNPVPGINETDGLVRGQLLTAAINVSRALTQFLGSALQNAAYSFQTIIGNGSRMVGTLARGSVLNRSEQTDS